MSLFNLKARLALDASNYNKGIGDAKSTASSFGNALKGIGKVGATAFGAITAAVVATTTAVVKGVKSTAEYGDNIDKMSQKMGLSAEAYQEWDAVMQHSGTSIESLQAGMKTLANAVANGNEAFEKLGITQEQISKMSQEDLFAATISGLQNVENETERTYLAGQLLGRGAVELGALLNKSSEETDAMRQRVHELGGVMSDDAVKASAAFQDNLQDFQTTLSGIKRQITAEFLPGVNEILSGFTSLIIGEEGAEDALASGFDKIFSTVDGLAGKISSVIEKIIPGLISAIPKLVSVGSKLLVGLVSGIVDNIDVIVDAVFEVVNILTGELLNGENIALIINAAFELINNLANGLTQNIPTLLPAIVEIIMNIVQALTDPGNLSSLVDAAIALLMSLADGLISSIGILIERAPTIIMNLVNAIVENAPKLLSGAAELIQQLTEGLIAALPNLISMLPGLVMQIMTAIVENAPMLISSGLELLMQLQFGFIENLPLILEQLPTMVQDIVDGIVANAPKLIESGIEAIVQLWEGIVQGIPELIDHLPELISAIGDGIKALASGLWDAGKSLVSGLWSGIKNAFSGGNNTEISDGISPDLDNVATKAETASAKAKTSFETNIGSIGTNSKVTSGLTSASSQFDQFATSVGTSFSTAATSVNTQSGKIQTSVTNMATKTTTAVGTQFSGLGRTITTSLAAVPSSTESSFDNIAAGATKSARAIQDTWSKLPDIFKTIFVRIRDVFAQAPQWFGTIFTNARNAVQSAWSGVPQWFRGIWNSISNAFPSYEAYDWGADMMDSFINGVQSRMSTLRSTIQNAANMIENMLGFSEPEEGPLSNFHTFAPDMMNLFAQGVKENEDVVRNQIAESFDFGDMIRGGIGEVTYSETGTGTTQEQLLTLLNRYLPQLANMRVVMDTGAVVGELRDGMNQSLGEVGRYDQRGLATT